MKPCALCGNLTHTMVPVGVHDHCELVCCRCAGVVKDRTRNMARGHRLLDGRKVIWRTGRAGVSS